MTMPPPFPVLCTIFFELNEREISLKTLNGQLKACPCSLGHGQAIYLIAYGKKVAAHHRGGESSFFQEGVLQEAASSLP
jgi:hypothetical protein